MHHIIVILLVLSSSATRRKSCLCSGVSCVGSFCIEKDYSRSLGRLLILLVFTACGGYRTAQQSLLGIFAWILLPGLLVLILIVVFVGAVHEPSPARAFACRGRLISTIDLNDPRRRKIFLVFAAVGIVFVSTSAFGSFQAYEATESVAFCGQTCHTVNLAAYRDTTGKHYP